MVLAGYPLRLQLLPEGPGQDFLTEISGAELRTIRTEFARTWTDLCGDLGQAYLKKMRNDATVRRGWPEQPQEQRIPVDPTPELFVGTF